MLFIDKTDYPFDICWKRALGLNPLTSRISFLSKLIVF